MTQRMIMGPLVSTPMVIHVMIIFTVLLLLGFFCICEKQNRLVFTWMLVSVIHLTSNLISHMKIAFKVFLSD